MKFQYRIAAAAIAIAILSLTLTAIIHTGPAAFGLEYYRITMPASTHSQKPATKDTHHSKKVTRDDLSVKAVTPALVGSLTYFSQFSAEDAAARKSNAALIVAIGKKRGFSDRSIAIAVATSIQETGLRNLNWGDADSLGLYQQRPSVKAWGTAAQIMDRTHAINQFYDRLLWYPKRDTMRMIDVAIKIQRPNAKYYYRDWKWDAIATQIVQSYNAMKGEA